MYKSRLSKWGFHKNVSRRDWKIAALMRHERQQKGKETASFKIHNRTKTVLELQRHIKECRVTEKEYIANARADGVTNSASIRCISPAQGDGDGKLNVSADSSDQPSTPSGPIGSVTEWTPTSSKDSQQSQLHERRHIPFDGVSNERPWPHQIDNNPSAVALLANTMPNISYRPSQTSGAGDEPKQMYDFNNIVQCDQVQQDLGIMIAETYCPNAFTQAFPEMQDIDSWELVANPDMSAEPKLCLKCQNPSRNHSPLPRNWFLQPSTELPQMLSFQITSTDVNEPQGSNEASKFEIFCFAACIYGGQEQYDMMSKSLQQADQVFEDMLLANNDMALLSVLLTLTILHAHNRGSMATSIIRSAYHVSARIHGDNNPLTLCIQWLTAAAGQKLSSCPIKSATLAAIHMHMEQTFGTAHQHTIVALYCLAFELNLEKRYAEAEEQFTRLCEICVTTLGERSLQTVSSLNGLGKSQRRQGKLTQAIDTLEKSLSKHPLGPNHPFRLDSMKELAKVYKEIGRKDLMENMYWDILKGRIKMLGKSHSFTEEAKIDLVRLLRELGKWDEEGVMEEKIQKLFEKGALTSDAEGF